MCHMKTISIKKGNEIAEIAISDKKLGNGGIGKIQNLRYRIQVGGG